MSHRTYGETRNCKGCRYWSEMIAMAVDAGGVQALCLNGESDQKGSYMYGGQTCAAWQSGHHGAVDEPPDYGEEVRRLYAAEDAEQVAAPEGGAS